MNCSNSLPHPFPCVSFHLLPLALCILFELSSIAGTSWSIYSINIGSESLHWCSAAVMEKVIESFLSTLPPFRPLFIVLFSCDFIVCSHFCFLAFYFRIIDDLNASFLYFRKLRWLTDLTVTIAKNRCMAASTSSLMTAPTASPAMTPCSRTHVTSAKNWLAMTQG